jgi:hypothetical protein
MWIIRALAIFVGGFLSLALAFAGWGLAVDGKILEALVAWAVSSLLFGGATAAAGVPKEE